jgi:deazaflavin-dependent oxidoreductase (nitroreductase family)
MDLMKVADRSWPVLELVMQLHATLYRTSRGRLGRRIPGLPPMLLLDHIGARSGRRRTAPLVYMPDGENLIVVGAKGGHPRDPGWVHNLRAFPDTQVQVGSDTIKVHAAEATAAERPRLWQMAVEYNPLWGRYQDRTDRKIPLIVLTPRSA